MKLIVPANLDIKALAVEPEYFVHHRVTRKVNGNVKKVYIDLFFRTKLILKHIDYCYSFIDTLIYVSELNDKFKDGDFTNLKREYMEDNLIPAESFDLCRSFLIALGVIECDGISVASHMRKKGQSAKSLGYRLTEAYRGEYRIIDVDLTSKAVKKKKRGQKKRLGKELKKPGNAVYQYEVKQFYEPNYYVKDKEAVLAFIPSMLGQKDSKGKIITEKRIQRMIQQVDSINLGENLRLVLDGYGRFHTIVTQMSKEARSFITGIDDKPLMQLDFSASYSYHLIQYIRDLAKGRLVFNNYHYSHSSLFPYAPALLEEVDRLAQIVSEEDLYQYIAQEYEKYHGMIHPDRKQVREIVKRCWNRSFLNVETDETKISGFIGGVLFPEINSFIEYRGRYALWTELMRSESELMHKRIIARIYKELGYSCTLFCVHDALLVDQRSAPVVRNIMDDESVNFFGFEPKIKWEILVRPNEVQEANTVSALVTKYG